jgi:hypothetical protein
MRALIVVLLFAAITYGWVNNIVQLVDEMNDPLTAKVIIRIVGIPTAPVGVVMGYID